MGSGHVRQAEDARRAWKAQGAPRLTPVRAKPPDPRGALPTRARDHVRGAQPRGPAIPLAVSRRSHAGGSSAPLRSAPRRGKAWGFEAALGRTARSPVVTRTVSHGSEPIQEAPRPTAQTAMLQYRLMRQDSSPTGPTRNPKTQAAFRRQVRLQIYLPLGFGIVAVAGAGIGLALEGVGTASAWADITLVYLLIVALIAGLIALAGVGALAFGVGWVIARLPGPAMQAQALVARAAGMVRRGAEAGIRPILVTRSAWASVRVALCALAGVLRFR